MGALLFIIDVYINDIPGIIKRCEIILYADNMLIYTEGNTDNNMMDDFYRVNRWLKMC